MVYGGANLGNIDLGNFAATDGFTLQGVGNGALIGFSVSDAGDVNGDGFDDLLVGAPGGAGGGNSYIVYGGANPVDVNLAVMTTANLGIRIEGGDPGGFLGVSVSSAGDINGDGFDDLIVGAPQRDDGSDEDVGGAYVIYGGATDMRGTVAVTQAGTVAADNFTGNAGNDSFTGIGLGDVVHGGAGDDAVSITGVDFAEVDGGRGTDALALNGTGLNLDLTGPRTDIESIEIIDLTGTGANTLTLNKLSVLEMSDATTGGITTFTVTGDTGDSVAAADFAGWTAGGQNTVDGVTFDVFTNDNAQLLIEDPVTFSAT